MPEQIELKQGVWGVHGMQGAHVFSLGGGQDNNFTVVDNISPCLLQTAISSISAIHLTLMMHFLPYWFFFHVWALNSYRVNYNDSIFEVL